MGMMHQACGKNSYLDKDSFSLGKPSTLHFLIYSYAAGVSARTLQQAPAPAPMMGEHPASTFS